MNQSTLIEKELSAAEEALKIARGGKTLVCAVRAVTLADVAWLANRFYQNFAGMLWHIFDGFNRTILSRSPSATQRNV